MTFFKVTTLLALFILSNAIRAADEIPAPPSLNKSKKSFTARNKNNERVPTLPDEVNDSRNIPQPEVRIIRKKDTVIEEYRVNGHLRYVKITPNKGKPYYMVDTDGDGILETRNNDLDNPPINQWILFEW